MKKPIIITTGEPAGIGPDIILKIFASAKKNQFAAPLVVLADRNLLQERAKLLGFDFDLPDFHDQTIYPPFSLLHHPLPQSVIPGKPDLKNATWILETLEKATSLCLQKKMHALVTGPVNKAIINQAGIAFTGHTEFLAKLTQTKRTVMMLVAEQRRVALVTTHIPLHQVATSLTQENLIECLTILNHSLKTWFKCDSPQIVVCGLNPHAGEEGHIGSEEIKIITPTLLNLKKNNFNLIGPVAADTAFNAWPHADVILAMYHDQGLPAIKALAFGNVVNVTLGLPIIRTSVDHGTAFSLAGTLKANETSLVSAIELAANLEYPT